VNVHVQLCLFTMGPSIGTEFDKIGEIGFKPTVAEHLFATFIVTCNLGPTVRLDHITGAWCYYLPSFVTNCKTKPARWQRPF